MTKLVLLLMDILIFNFSFLSGQRLRLHSSEPDPVRSGGKPHKHPPAGRARSGRLCRASARRRPAGQSAPRHRPRSARGNAPALRDHLPGRVGKNPVFYFKKKTSAVDFLFFCSFGFFVFLGGFLLYICPEERVSRILLGASRL
jgi:hypothetical protein